MCFAPTSGYVCDGYGLAYLYATSARMGICASAWCDNNNGYAGTITSTPTCASPGGIWAFTETCTIAVV